MGCYVRCFFSFSLYWWMVALAVVFIDSQGFASSNETQSQVSNLFLKAEADDINGLNSQLNDIQKTVVGSLDPLQQSRDFLDSFIQEINIRYGLSLTLQQACILVNENVHLLNLSEEEQITLLAAIKLIQTGHATVGVITNELSFNENHSINSHKLRLYWPWDWNWFGLNKPSHHHNKSIKANKRVFLEKHSEVELPGNCYFGACELLAGALLCIIPHPTAWRLGAGLAVDGGRRVVEGLIQHSDEMRLDPKYERPKSILNGNSQ